MKRKTVEPVKFGKASPSKTSKGPKMLSEEREVSVTIKASQLFASLHFTGVIRDNDEILSVVFDNSVVGKDIKSGEPDVGIPITIRFKKQEKVQS